MDCYFELLNIQPLAATDESSLSWLLNKILIWGAVALGVGFVVFIHELGHFLAAKLFGVKVEKFYVGFDVPIKIFGIRLPRTFGKVRWGETEYGIGVIPLGGYVKMLGQDDDPRRAAEERERIRLANENRDPADGEVAYELDPRSYPAKSVYQRMVIISAGVIMNLITSVFFAAIAFGLGVDYTPAVVGSTVPGYPAWEVGVEPGGRVVEVGSIEHDEKLHFREMVSEIMMSSLGNPDEPVRVGLQYGDELREYELTPKTSAADGEQKLVGVGMAHGAQIGDRPFIMPNSAAAMELGEADQLAGAEVIAVNSQPIEIDPQVGVRTAFSMEAAFASQAAEPVVLTVEKDQQQSDVTLPPQAFKSLGFHFGVGPVAGLVEKGPAATAGIKKGDRIVGILGHEGILDAFTTPNLISASGSEVILRIERGAGEEIETLEITVSRNPGPITRNPWSTGSGQIEVQSLGLTYYPTVTVASIDPNTSNAAETAVQIGDRVKKLRVVWSEGKLPDSLQAAIDDDVLSKSHFNKLAKGIEVSDGTELVNFTNNLQLLPAGTEFALQVERGEQKQIVEATAVVVNTNEFWYERGLLTPTVTLKQYAGSVGEAMQLGWRESKRRLSDVFGFLKILVTGRASRKAVAGPVGIFDFAGAAASRGPSALLLFLTLLSVNLAVLNFLPIPALDGGHMVFLTAEAVRGKPVGEELQARLTMAGVLMLLGLMLFALVNDVVNISSRGG